MKKLPRPLERTVQRSIVQRLAVRGITLWRRNIGGFTDDYGHYVKFSESGQSDLWGIDLCNHWARHWEIETKRYGEIPAPKQLAWLKEMTIRGCVAFWADDPNVADSIAMAVLDGGRIHWHEDHNFDVRFI